eukprot:8221630-Alexandrium_andersonii.AAC.1
MDDARGALQDGDGDVEADLDGETLVTKRALGAACAAFSDAEFNQRFDEVARKFGDISRAVGGPGGLSSTVEGAVGGESDMSHAAEDILDAHVALDLARARESRDADACVDDLQGLVSELS